MYNLKDSYAHTCTLQNCTPTDWTEINSSVYYPVHFEFVLKWD